jgi:hypothetical protein
VTIAEKLGMMAALAQSRAECEALENLIDGERQRRKESEQTANFLRGELRACQQLDRAAGEHAVALAQAEARGVVSRDDEVDELQRIIADQDRLLRLCRDEVSERGKGRLGWLNDHFNKRSHALAAPSQPEPAKVHVEHAFLPPPTDSADFCDFAIAKPEERGYKPCGRPGEEHAPENAGTACSACDYCKDEGGYPNCYWCGRAK